MRTRIGRRILTDVSRILRFKEAAVWCGADPLFLSVSVWHAFCILNPAQFRVGSRTSVETLASKPKDNETMTPERALALIQAIFRRLNDGQSWTKQTASRRVQWVGTELECNS